MDKSKEKAKTIMKPPIIPNSTLIFMYYQELRRVKLSKQMKKEEMKKED